ncbi:MAG: alpha-ribazole phosphatase [Eubacterium sp.]|nr:alpha-ribazole phosphatase [Eubacterium sp.]
MRIYLIRHGETEMNARGCYYGITDASLTEKGRQQASLLAGCLGDMTWDRIVVSPLSRALETARLITGSMEDSFELEDSLKEQNFGLFEGKTYRELCEDFPEEMKAWNSDFSHYRLPGGESFREVRDRVEAWVRTIPEGPGQMLVVAHKGTLGHILAAMLRLPLEGYWHFVFDQGSYSVVDLEDGYAILRKLNQSAQPQDKPPLMHDMETEEAG